MMRRKVEVIPSWCIVAVPSGFGLAVIVCACSRVRTRASGYEQTYERKLEILLRIV